MQNLQPYISQTVKMVCVKKTLW